LQIIEIQTKEVWAMSTSNDAVSHFPKRIVFGLVALVVSATIAWLIANGIAQPYPDLKFAYLICVAVAVAGLIQLIIGVAEKPN
jgi:hypothetical protein